MTPATLHIVGAIARIEPDRLTPVRTWLAERPDVEIATSDAKGTLILVLEGPHDRALADTMEEIRNLDGVVDLGFVYHEQVPGEEVAPCT